VTSIREQFGAIIVGVGVGVFGWALFELDRRNVERELEETDI